MNNSLGTREKPGCLRSYIIIGQRDSGGKREREGGLIHKLKRMLQSTLGRQAGRQAGRQGGESAGKKKTEQNSVIAWSHAGSCSSISGRLNALATKSNSS